MENEKNQTVIKIVITPINEQKRKPNELKEKNNSQNHES